VSGRFDGKTAIVTGAYQLAALITVEIEGGDKPGCVVETLSVLAA
jgi:hypothetical protein